MKLIMVFNNDDISKTLTEIISYNILNLDKYDDQSNEFTIRINIKSSTIEPRTFQTRFRKKHNSTQVYNLDGWQNIVYSNAGQDYIKDSLIIPKFIRPGSRDNRDQEMEDKSIVLMTKDTTPIQRDLTNKYNILCLDVYKEKQCNKEYNELKSILSIGGTHPNKSNEGVAGKWFDRYIIL
jgi:hypothetical protein